MYDIELWADLITRSAEKTVEIEKLKARICELEAELASPAISTGGIVELTLDGVISWASEKFNELFRLLDGHRRRINENERRWNDLDSRERRNRNNLDDRVTLLEGKGRD